MQDCSVQTEGGVATLRITRRIVKPVPLCKLCSCLCAGHGRHSVRVSTDARTAWITRYSHAQMPRGLRILNLSCSLSWKASPPKTRGLMENGMPKSGKSVLGEGGGGGLHGSGNRAPHTSQKQATQIDHCSSSCQPFHQAWPMLGRVKLSSQFWRLPCGMQMRSGDATLPSTDGLAGPWWIRCSFVAWQSLQGIPSAG